MSDPKLLHLAQVWLGRQRATHDDDMVDEGDCLMCGSRAGEGHEDTDPCGIVANLLAERAAQEQEIARLHEKEADYHDLISELWARVEPDVVADALVKRVHVALGADDPDGHCGNRICAALTKAEADLATVRQEVARLREMIPGHE